MVHSNTPHEVVAHSERAKLIPEVINTKYGEAMLMSSHVFIKEVNFPYHLHYEDRYGNVHFACVGETSDDVVDEMIEKLVDAGHMEAVEFGLTREEIIMLVLLAAVVWYFLPDSFHNFFENIGFQIGSFIRTTFIEGT